MQQESKRQRLSLESLNASPIVPASMGMSGQFSADMFPMSHVNGMPMLDHSHMKRDADPDDELDQGPGKRMRIEDSPHLLATLQCKYLRLFNACY